MGRKKDCVGDKNVHYRIYANPAVVNGTAVDRNYSTIYGYYVVGSTHRDKTECSPETTQEYGYGEPSEDELANDARGAPFIDSVVDDAVPLYNREILRGEEQIGTDEVHVWYNNAFATEIRLIDDL